MNERESEAILSAVQGMRGKLQGYDLSYVAGRIAWKLGTIDNRNSRKLVNALEAIENEHL